MEELTKKITTILDQFAKEELGNRLSQFSMIALKEMILNVIKEEQKEVKKEVKEDIKGNKK
jgi:hypothetical protein